MVKVSGTIEVGDEYQLWQALTKVLTAQNIEVEDYVVRFYSAMNEEARWVLLKDGVIIKEFALAFELAKYLWKELEG